MLLRVWLELPLWLLGNFRRTDQRELAHDCRQLLQEVVMRSVNLRICCKVLWGLLPLALLSLLSVLSLT